MGPATPRSQGPVQLRLDRRGHRRCQHPFWPATSRGVSVIAGDQEDADSRAVARAVARADVPHVVYSSVGGADRDSGVPHSESKRRVEKALTEVVPASFVRPTFFSENLARALGPSEDPEFEIAGDELTCAGIADRIAPHLAKPGRFEELPMTHDRALSPSPRH